MEWWLWILLGVALLIVEVTVDAAFYLLFIGLAAMLVGLAVLLGVAGPPLAEWLIFAGASLALLYLVRGRLRALFLKRQGGEVELVVGGRAVAVTDMAPGAQGKATLRGAEWKARNLGPGRISAGESVRVAEVEQLVLGLKPEQAGPA